MEALIYQTYDCTTILRYEYRTADALVKDFELMKTNAVKFNGAQNQIAEEAIEIHKFVRDQVEASRSEFSPLEEEVEELMSGKANKHQKAGKKKVKGIKLKAGRSSSSGGSGGNEKMGGINIGDISQSLMDDNGDGSDTDTDDDILDFDL
jgi:Bromodomain